MNPSRRLAFALLGSTALTGCAAVQSEINSLGTVAGQAAAAKLVGYVQYGVTTLEAGLTMFAADIPKNLADGATTAFNALSAGAASIGADIAAGATLSTLKSTASNIGVLIQSAAKALAAGLKAIPNPSNAVNIAIQVADGIATWAPTVTAFVDNLINPPTAPTVKAMMFMPGARRMRLVMP